MNFTLFKKMILKITENKAVDYAAFLKFLDDPSIDVSYTKQDIQASKIGNTLYLLTLSEGLQSQLEKYVLINNEDRVSASLHNNSHSKKVSGSWLVVRSARNQPELRMVDKHGNMSNEDSAFQTAIIVENKENFLRINETALFLSKSCDIPSSVVARSLFIFADGNQITNSLHKAYLQQFDLIYCFLDVDVGGLQIASNLMRLLPDSNVTFLTPIDIKKRLHNVPVIANPKDIERVIAIGQEQPSLALIASYIKQAQRVLEQESYLHVDK
ncbi:hypothetical protein [Glaciecola sp. 33A]|uniref:hypothetical protein n=1 Tax=Glaciecola sp. 33A TaxID=2057807 RepID=UPI000C32D094|nr:hypothetical protein [Glaciecola sp. 33A]PKI02510.1 hypothetical protein CXF81_06115 [Glaciecola sp. 33A]